MGNMKFKVGDSVRIKSLDWYNKNKTSEGCLVCGSSHINPEMICMLGKIATISSVEGNHYRIKEYGWNWTDEMIEGLVEEETKPKYEDEVNGEYYSTPKYLVRPIGYQFVDENGNVINTTKIVLEKKKKEYPKTYEECCKILGLLNVDLCFNADYRSFDASKEQWKRLGLMNQFYQLLICRDAYWKIYGEEMGLGKPWKPDWNDGELKWCMSYSGNYIEFDQYKCKHHTLAFPTEEMRDAFYENFKELIEQCKELL